MAQEETPVLPAEIDVFSQAADVATRPARRSERATRTPKEPKTTRSRTAAPAVAEPVSEVNPDSAVELSTDTAAGTPVETSAEANSTAAASAPAEANLEVFDDSATAKAPAKSESLELPLESTSMMGNEAVMPTPEKSAEEEPPVSPAKTPNVPVAEAEGISSTSTMENSRAEMSRSDAPRPDVARPDGARPDVPRAEAPRVEEYPLTQPRSMAPMQNPLEALPREERSLESRGVRFRGREGRVEVRGRQGVPIVGDPRALRREEREMREMRDPREAREPHEYRDPRERMRDTESGGLPSGRLAPPARDPRLEPRVEGRAEARPENRSEARIEGRVESRVEARPENRGENRGEVRDPQARGRFERDLPRGRQELDLSTLEDKNLTELREIAKGLNIVSATSLKKNELVFKILEQQAENHGHQFKRGILDILPDGKGFLRTEGYLAGNEDVYVSQSQIKRFNLKTGDMVTGMVRPPKEMERHYGLLRVEAINGEAPDFSKARKEFERLTPIFPTQKFTLETGQENITARIIDLVTPIGKGQRGLIVAPPKAGKTSLIKSIANSIAINHPEVILIVLLIDERPEEVTDIARSVKGEVVASTFDELPENHMRVAEMVFEKAKRLAEQKKDVVILMDSLTRLARASNLVVNPSGRTMTGGLDPAAMHRPKRMFGAARNIEEGGSLTILATVLVDTGSRMDEYIFEELKGTGNMDLVLDRSLFDARIFPAIDINKSGTRRDDLLLSKEDMNATLHLRRTLAALDNDKAINLLIDRLKNTKTNEEFMQIVQRSSRAQGNQ